MNLHVRRFCLQITALLVALAFGSPVLAKPATRKPKKILIPARIVRPSGVVINMNDERYQSGEPAVKIAYVAPATDTAPTWAGTVGAHIMSEKVINYMEDKYTAAESYMMGGNVRNFIYFYGFDVTSQDVRGTALYGINQRQEIELRKNMTSSLRSYMLGKGMMEYLKSLEFAQPYVSTVEKVEKASQLSVEIKSTDPTAATNQKPWKITTGPDLGSRTIFAKASNGAWNLELRDSFKLNDMRLVSGFDHYRSQYSLRFLNASNVVAPGYQYQVAKLWWAKWSADFPLKGIDRAERVFHTVTLRHLF